MKLTTKLAEANVRGNWDTDRRFQQGALSSEQEAEAVRLSGDKFTTVVILLIGAPPASTIKTELSLDEYANHIHDLAYWSSRALATLKELWGCDDEMYDSTPIFRVAFDKALRKMYSLKYED